MDSLSLNQIKTLIEINARINSNYSDINALLVYILESAMHLVECESSSLLLVNKNDETLRFMVALGPKGAEAMNIPVDKKSIAGWVSENNKPLILNNVASDPHFFNFVQRKTGYVSRNMIALPMRVKGICIGVIELINKKDSKSFDDKDLEILTMLSNQASIAYMNAHAYRSAQDNIAVLSEQITSGSEYHPFVAKSAAVLDIIKIIEVVGNSNTTILLTGESGVGKELFAEQIHLRGNRRDKPFVRVNCAALSSALLESELFGHVKGAFTDAVSDRKGRFEIADGGTIFLDEIGEIPLEMQAKLLRVLQEHQFEKVGSSKTISVDVRVLAATNRNLEEMVAEGKFRSDLYYRLNVVPINIPPLRERVDDIEPLATFFLKKFSIETKKNFLSFTESALRTMYKYYWPGNIRELENSVERACVLGTPPYIKETDLKINCVQDKLSEKQESELLLDDSIELSDEDRTLKAAVTRFKTAYIKKILNETSWNQTKACKILGVQRTYVSRLLNELHIR